MYKNLSHINYVKDYKFLNELDAFRCYQKLDIKKVIISLNSHNCMVSRKDIQDNTRTNTLFHANILSLLKLLEPKIVALKSAVPLAEDFSAYESGVIINDKREILSLLELLVYEQRFLDRLSSDYSIQVSHISHSFKKLQIQIPLFYFEDLVEYSLLKIKDFEVKTIRVNFSFYVSVLK